MALLFNIVRVITSRGLSAFFMIYCISDSCHSAWLTVDNQKTLRLEVIEGEDEDPEYDTIIGTTLMDLTPRPKGSPLKFMMQCDANGIIHVRVKDNVDGKDLGEIHIDREANLTDEEVNDKKKFIGGIDIE